MNIFNFESANQFRFSTLMRRLTEALQYVDSQADLEKADFNQILNQVILYLQQDEIDKLNRKRRRK